MTFKLSRYHFKLIIIVLVLLNFFFLGGTWLYETAGVKTVNITRFLLLQLDLGFENVLAAWYSSMLFLPVSIMCIFCFFIDKKRFERKIDAWINCGWLILALVFMVLSLDELGSFHETIGDTSLFEIFGKSEGWEVFYVLIILVGAFMILFSWLRLRRMPAAAAFMILGVLLLLTNPFQENFEIESMQNSVNPSQWRRPVIFLLLEEGSEIFATTCFLVSTIIYYSYAAKQIKSRSKIAVQDDTAFISKSILLKLGILLVVLLGIIMIVVGRYFPREVGNDTGVPKNWFPAAIAFLASFVTFYFFHNGPKKGRALYLYISLLSIILSAYYGIDLYRHHFNELVAGEKVFDWVIIATVIILGIGFSMALKEMKYKTLIYLWIICLCLAFGLNKLYTAELTFAGYSFLLIALVPGFYTKNYIGNQQGVL